MSLKNDAHHLRRALVQLHRRGHTLRKSNPSMEQAVHFQELANAYLHSVEIQASTASMESVASPEELVKTTMEGIGDVLKGLINLLRGKSKENKDDRTYKEKIDDYTEMQRKMTQGFSNKAWLDKAEFVEGDVSIPAFRAPVFHRGQSLYQNIDDLTRELNKDLGEYSAIYKVGKPVAVAYTKWASETWDKTEQHYTKNRHDSESHDDSVADAFYQKVTDIIVEQLKKRPPTPLEKLNVSNHARMGSPVPDNWTGDKKFNTWDMTYIAKGKNPISLPALDRAGLDKAVVMYGKLMAFCEELEQFYNDLHDLRSFQGFDDYPWRDDLMADALYNATKGAESFDLHFFYDTVTPPFSGMAERTGLLADALYDWIRKSVKTQP